MTDVPSDPAHLVLADWSTLLKKFQLYLNNICQLRLMGVDKNNQRFNLYIYAMVGNSKRLNGELKRHVIQSAAEN